MPIADSFLDLFESQVLKLELVTLPSQITYFHSFTICFRFRLTDFLLVLLPRQLTCRATLSSQSGIPLVWYIRHFQLQGFQLL